MQKIKFLTIPKAAERSGISRTLLCGAVKRGLLRTVVLSKRTLIPAEALDEFVQQARRGCLHSRPKE